MSKIHKPHRLTKNATEGVLMGLAGIADGLIEVFTLGARIGSFRFDLQAQYLRREVQERKEALT